MSTTRPRPGHRAALAVPAALAAALLLAGCGGGGDAEKPARTAAPETEESAEAPAPEDEAEEPTEEPDAAASEGAGCLEGTWVASAESIEESTLSAPGMSEMNAQVSVSSDSRLVFEDGISRSEYDDQTTEVKFTVEGQDVVTTTTFDGAVVGSYTATDTEVTIADVDVSGVTLESTSVIGGEEVALPDIDLTEALGSQAGGTSSYTCEGDTLTLTPQLEGATGFEQVFTRE